MSTLGIGTGDRKVSRGLRDRETQPHTSSKAWMANEVSQTCEPLVP